MIKQSKAAFVALHGEESLGNEKAASARMMDSTTHYFPTIGADLYRKKVGENRGIRRKFDKPKSK